MFEKLFRQKDLKKDRKTGSGLTGALLSQSANSLTPFSKAQIVNKYGTTPYLKLCIDKIAHGIGQSKLTLYERQRNGISKVINKHDMIELLRNPNPLMVQSELLGALAGAIELHGESYVWIERKGNKPIYLWAFTPKEIVQKPTQANGFTWKANLNGKIYLMKNSDILTFRDWDFSNLYSSGCSTAHSVSDNILTNREITTYLQTFFNNNCEPSSIVSLEDTDADELQEFKENFESSNTGTFQKFKTFFVNKKIQFQKLTSSLSELGVVPLQEYQQDTIRTAFSIPKSLLGEGSANRASALLDKDMFISEVLQPKTQRILDVINIKLCSEYGDLYFESSIESDSDKERTIKLISICSEAFTINEIRAVCGYERMAEGDRVPSNTKKERGVNEGYDREYDITNRAEKTFDISNN